MSPFDGCSGTKLHWNLWMTNNNNIVDLKFTMLFLLNKKTKVAHRYNRFMDFITSFESNELCTILAKDLLIFLEVTQFTSKLMRHFVLELHIHLTERNMDIWSRFSILSYISFRLMIKENALSMNMNWQPT